MSLQENFSTYTYEAGSAIDQYIMVANSTTVNRRAGICAAGALPTGVTLNKSTAQGQALTVANNGIVKIMAGAAILNGAFIASDAAGKAVTAATGNYAIGRAVTAGGTGEIIEVQWLGPWIAA